MDILMFFLSFVVILLGCELFTNGVEWIGKRFKLSEGCVGSLLAAVGTALPETLIPIIAILFVGGESGHEIGTGAILGAPFMLATLALFVCGISVFLFAKRRQTTTLNVNGQCIRRDLKFFLMAYTLAIIAALAPPEFDWFKWVLGFALIPLYGVYIWYTYTHGIGACAEDEVKQLYTKKVVDRVKKRPETGFEDPIAGSFDLIRENEPSTPLIFLQVAAALGLIIIGANMFVEQIEAAALELGISTVILALIITPIATELPEKFNSFMWIRNRKDTFAIGNITGAMVFQSCIPVTIGILFTNWHLNLGNTPEMLQAVSIVIALFSGVVLYLESSHREIKKSGLFLGGLLYALFVVLVIFSV